MRRTRWRFRSPHVLAVLALSACGARTGVDEPAFDATNGSRRSDAAVDCLPDLTPYLGWYFGTLTTELTSWRYLTDAGPPGATYEGSTLRASGVLERVDGGGVRFVVVYGVNRIPVAIVQDRCSFTVQRNQFLPDVNGTEDNLLIYEGTFWYSHYALSLRLRVRGRDYAVFPVETEGFDTFEGRRP